MRNESFVSSMKNVLKKIGLGLATVFMATYGIVYTESPNCPQLTETDNWSISEAMQALLILTEVVI